jgi:hypothetical protein
MTVDDKENLIINIGGKTQCFDKNYVKDALRAHKIDKELEDLTFCAKYNRDNEDLLKPNDKCFDPIVEAVREDLMVRSGKGFMKYGVLLSRTDIDLKGWLNHAYEEALDMANYLKRSIKELEKNEQ